MFYITFNNSQLDKAVFCGVGDIERKWLKNNRDPIQDILFIESLDKKVTTIDRGNSMCF